MRDKLARVLEEGRSGDATDRVLRARFWSPRAVLTAAEVVDLAAWRHRKSLLREE